MSNAATVLTVVTRSAAPRREPAGPTDETERLADYGVFARLTSAQLEACPGLLVVHADGSTECVESASCPADPVLHAGASRCAEVGLDCC